MNNIKKRKFRSEKGSVFAELALVIPLLAVLVLAIFEVSRMYHLQNNIEHAAKQAARTGASFRESCDQNFMGRGTVSQNEVDNLIIEGGKVPGIVEERNQFMIRYLNMSGNEVMGAMSLPFNRQNNPGSIEFIEVEITYPGQNPPVNTPIPAVLNPWNIFMDGGVTLMSKAVFKVEGRFE